MKKSIIKAVLFFSLVFTSYNNFAQDEAAFDKGTVVVTGGYGFPDLYRGTLRVAYNSYNSTTVKGFGPLILKGDYGIVKFKWGHSVGAGMVIGFNATTVEYNYNYYLNWLTPVQNYRAVDKYKTITIGARGTYHFFTKEKFDCYASVGLGFNINSVNQTTNDPNGVSISAKKRSGMYQALTVGVRYYFTKNIGVYSELGWDMSAPIQGGIAIKF